ncbi:5-formyltetrahydrofolate cyclo-ligase [Peribacillus glennii]|uniref:5-formyltetrahydrofolate cyclo-ligase n=1 Tax=Peribacillus glennii TaxID=2303991 RepID=A0A372LJB8_9BACI|nr:5-formyltetrahydrofolate cyclo-ligase [Peribacillus glennii]RFU65706.1 5-formyltetrahydrofolate cyclo-ligase [Peribacillus glennii]
MNEVKKEIRGQLKSVLQNISEPDYRTLSRKIAKNLFKLGEWEKAKVVGVTVSNVPEVDTREIIKKAWEQGKEVAVPKCFPKEKSIQFRKITSLEQLETVFFGLQEPILNETTEAPREEIDLLIVPGLGYTRTGYRIGFGGGYYDRFLPYYNGPTLSLAFNEQVLPALPIEKHDIPVGKLITPERVFVCNA